MIKTWKHKGLKKLYKSGKVVKGMDPARVKRVVKLLDHINAAETIPDLHMPGARFHKLTAPLLGHLSLDVNGNYRITFKFKDGHCYDVDYHDTH